MVTGSVIGRASAQCEYTVAHTLPNGPLCNGKPYAPNIQAIADDGSVCGFAGAGVFCPDRPFIWHPGDAQLTFLPFAPGTVSGQAYDLNQGNVVVGMCRNAADTQLPCRWVNGVASLLTMPAGFTTGVAAAVNASGMIAGYVGNGVIFHAVTWTDGAVQDLHTVLPAGYTTSRAHDISDNGIAVGRASTGGQAGIRAAIWQDAGVTILPAITGGISSQAVAVNSAGQVVGFGARALIGDPLYAERSYIWSNGLMSDLGVIDGLRDCMVQDLNDAGDAVGYCKSGVTVRGFMWRNNNLSSVVIEGSPLQQPVEAINGDATLADSRRVLAPIAAPPYDINADCTVNVNDLLAVINNWGFPGGDADCSQDGIVDWQDLMLVLMNWNQ